MHSSAGPYGYGEQNSREQWLLAWFSTQCLKITNSHFRKQDAKLITYETSRAAKQLDYLLLDRRLNSKLRDIEATTDIDLGSDHKCLVASFSFQSRPKREKNTTPKKATFAAPWPPKSLERYQQKLGEMLHKVEPDDTVEHKHLKIQEAIIEASKQERRDKPSTSNPKCETKLEELIAKRKALPSSDTAGRTAVSKVIFKEVRTIRAEARASRINHLLENFSKLKTIGGIKERKKANLTIEMEDAHGSVQSDHCSILEIFAKFYEDLYSHRNVTDDENLEAAALHDLPPFTEEELKKALCKLKAGKAKDAKGLVAEMMKHGGHQLRIALLDLFNSVLSSAVVGPHEWSCSVMTVIFKSGDAKQAKNYRPICVLPLLYKLFSTLLYSRLAPTIEEGLDKHQAGFRKDFSTLDHLHALTQVQEKTSEWQLETWMAFIDFQKAFDSVEHHAIWSALKALGVDTGYIRVLQKVYGGQTG